MSKVKNIADKLTEGFKKVVDDLEKGIKKGVKLLEKHDFKVEKRGSTYEFEFGRSKDDNTQTLPSPVTGEQKSPKLSTLIVVVFSLLVGIILISFFFRKRG